VYRKIHIEFFSGQMLTTNTGGYLKTKAQMDYANSCGVKYINRRKHREQK